MARLPKPFRFGLVVAATIAMLVAPSSVALYLLGGEDSLERSLLVALALVCSVLAPTCVRHYRKYYGRTTVRRPARR